MVTVRAFKGLRPLPEKAAGICSPPYDVLSAEEARKIAAANPETFLKIIKPEITFEPGIDEYSAQVYARGAENLEQYIQQGILNQDSEPAFYIYRLEWNAICQTGIMAAASVEDYTQGLIKRHELTRSDKENDRTRHIDSQSANAGPVFLTYKENPAVSNIINEWIASHEPDVAYTREDTGVSHTMWVITEPKPIIELETVFNDVPALYIADGHHRAFAASRVRALRRERGMGAGPWDYFLTLTFPDNQLNLMDYNRVISSLNDLSTEDFLSAVKKSFTIRSGEGRPAAPHSFGMYLDGTWYRLTAKPGTFPEDDPVDSLDVAILHNNLIGPILGITDLKTDKRIAFIGGTRGIEELTRRVDNGDRVAFALFPTTIPQLMAIADTDAIMPPKSTWFFPKPDSGMVTYKY